ncbi:beta-1,3-galactosyltransferase 5-like [Latimeria chalumnae]|uniref:Hexosyltransferase n=1 Tax=Latimeria chalumnae TaxID=7897 RepID=H3AK50_LATCH|nr:PREDICTED: beta-1,3-galactosyltransferase 5-like [Latimeria chalumnae]|eukprot:XP_006006548.2 PREDICTED: beta-1,3-galactosyltransferase 5-like [Latimeria chalumnae]
MPGREGRIHRACSFVYKLGRCMLVFLLKHKWKVLLFYSVISLVVILLSNNSGKHFNCYKVVLSQSAFTLKPNQKVCCTGPFLVVLVSVSANQIETRRAIRDTWASNGAELEEKVVTYFLLGFPQDITLQAKLVLEHEKYGDIIQKPFQESYQNMTIKTLMGFEWVKNFCNKTTYVMKTEGDVLVNLEHLLFLLKKTNHRKGLYTGLVKLAEEPNRNQDNRIYVSWDEYPGYFYPPYCSGTGYVLSQNLVAQVFEVAHRVKTMKLEDVFVGMCLQMLDILPSYISSTPVFFDTFVPYSPCIYKQIVTSHGIKPAEMEILWQLLKQYSKSHCRDENYFHKHGF